MHTVFRVLILSIPLFIIIACHGNDAPDDPQFHMPESQLDENVFYNFLDRYNIARPYEMPDPPVPEEFFRERLNEYKAALEKDVIDDEPEIRYFLYSHIGGIYEHLSRHEPEAIEQVIEYREKAVAMFEEDPAYAIDLSGNYLHLAEGYIRTGRFDEGFSRFRHIIDEYADSDIGLYPNWYSVTAIERLYNSVFKFIADEDPHDPAIRKVAHYLDQLGTRYDNEIGFAANIHMFKYNRITGNDDEAQLLKQTIDDQFPAYEENEYLWRMWAGLPEEMERRIELGEYNN